MTGGRSNRGAMRILYYVLVFVLGAALAYVVTNVKKLTGPSFNPLQTTVIEVDLSYTDFVTAMFTGATLVLTGVALLVALVAIFTYQGIKNEAARTIRTEVERQLELLEERIDRAVGEEAEEKISNAIEKAGRSGSLDRALERALIAIGQGRTELSGELEEGFDPDDNDER